MAAITAVNWYNPFRMDQRMSAMSGNKMAQSASAWMSAALLLAAGLCQISALKTGCLSKCRSPLGFFMAKWRDVVGAERVLGVGHGGYCVGCCWALMAVMFVVGSMNHNPEILNRPANCLFWGWSSAVSASIQR